MTRDARARAGHQGASPTACWWSSAAGATMTVTLPLVAAPSRPGDDATAVRSG